VGWAIKECRDLKEDEFIVRFADNRSLADGEEITIPEF
jgi:hypothetical protein